jgi:hypothetical protein
MPAFQHALFSIAIVLSTFKTRRYLIGMIDARFERTWPMRFQVVAMIFSALLPKKHNSAAISLEI